MNASPIPHEAHRILACYESTFRKQITGWLEAYMRKNQLVTLTLEDVSIAVFTVMKTGHSFDTGRIENLDDALHDRSQWIALDELTHENALEELTRECDLLQTST